MHCATVFQSLTIYKEKEVIYNTEVIEKEIYLNLCKQSLSWRKKEVIFILIFVQSGKDKCDFRNDYFFISQNMAEF